MVKRVVVSLSAIFKESRRLGLVGSAPTVGVTHKKTNRDNLRAVVPSKTELTAIIAAATEHGPFWRAFVLTAIFAGLRASELRGLRWTDVDPINGTIHVAQRADAKGRIGKCKSQAAYRTIPISTEVCEALRIWRLQCPHGELGLVFPNSRGGVFNYRNLIRRGFEPIQLSARVVARQGDAKYGLHSMRHSCASLWIESGFNPKKIQALMGHSSIQMTYDTYGHLFVDADADQRAAARVQHALLGQGGG
jgi:integrase